MLNLQACATVDQCVLDELEAVDNASKKAEWSRQTNTVKAFKKAVMDHGLDVQDHKCAWCEARVGEQVRRTPHRDHIAPKELYGKWTFLPINIVVACEACNGFAVKCAVDTVKAEADNYEDCEFRIVHPYLDDPDEHIDFVQEDKRVLMVGLTDKGSWTITNMKLDGTSATVRRAFESVLNEIDLPQDQADLLHRAMAAMS